MKITWNWLAELLELEQPVDRVVDRLTMSGLEVESVDRLGEELGEVRGAEVVATRPHPNADRLTVCEVRGASGLTTVVCGARNVRPGMMVAHAAPGACLPGGTKITTAEIRGVVSAGMLCSERELGLGSDDAGILDLTGLAQVGDPVARALGYEDTVLDISITPNRGDCLSILGMAREISALTGQRLRRRVERIKEPTAAASETIEIRIADPSACGRYVARLLTDVDVKPSPAWMRYRLEAVGVRAINNVVDITNYVMLERGQPLHAFDYDRLQRGEIAVRSAGTDRSFRTLDGQIRALEPTDLVIDIGGTIVALAGIMGGEESGVVADTRRVLLESAWFLPSAIRRTSRRLGLRSESSFRFERATDIEAVAQASDRAAALLVEHAGARLSGPRIDRYPGQRPSPSISLRLARAKELLGMELARNQVTATLKGLGMGVSGGTRGCLSVAVPSYRTDVTREIDLIEELVRVIGYDQVPTTLPVSEIRGAGESLERRRLRGVREALLALGLTEAVPLSFCSRRLNELFPSPDGARVPVAILNPISPDEAEMRLSLCASLVRAARHNMDQGQSKLGLFVLGKVFWKEDGYREERRLGGLILASVPSQGLGAATASDFATAKGIVESVLDALRVAGTKWERCTDLPSFHPGKSARILVDGVAIGVLGALHPVAADELDLGEPCWLFELDLEKMLQYGRAPVIFKELQRFPAVIRDVAVLVDRDFASTDVVEFVREWKQSHPLLEDLVLFDEYEGSPIPSGKKSLAYSIAYRALDRTLTDSEVNVLHAGLKEAMQSALEIELR